MSRSFGRKRPPRKTGDVGFESAARTGASDDRTAAQPGRSGKTTPSSSRSTHPSSRRGSTPAGTSPDRAPLRVGYAVTTGRLPRDGAAAAAVEPSNARPAHAEPGGELPLAP